MALRTLWRRVKSQSEVGRAVTWNLVGLATWLPVVAWFHTHVAELALVNGPSMYPLLNSNKDSSGLRDWVLNWKWKAQDDLEKGMIVTLRSPAHPNSVSVKRIIALEGESVTTKPPYPSPVMQVPQGHVWVEGDSVDSSLDSNTYGPVSRRLIIGKVTHIVFPFTRFGPIDWRAGR